MAERLQLPWLKPGEAFPSTRFALGPGSDAPGLLAAGGDLSPATLEAAYSRGIFPWFSERQPILWWSPDPRMVLKVEEFKLHRSLRKTLQRFVATPGCEVRVDSAFDEVIESCAAQTRPGQRGTWIVKPMVQAYRHWHRLGKVHSFETWMNHRLVGGLYGVSLGRMFFGESMFTRERDASKIALAALVCFCRLHGIAWIDCQQNTEHLASLGAAEVARQAFEQHLAQVVGMHAPPVEWFYHQSHWKQIGMREQGP